ncbi:MULTISPECIES: hypothetical protein [unclassified Rathayibacter]|uniref:hypothetical protein n=1 Tax=unclassified Rathayibacter TaxID=2609250 RepID=UPI00188A6B56|nr:MULTISPECIES: hypothetical protein [unclassified Rathayibacter]MBF4460972.1 hypothetical protein [Rathayibacter sp. VKM Ac-2879]MBF4502383.1 hypothetical protein [Rathayibacter sp. VKM Ac-2878]
MVDDGGRKRGEHSGGEERPEPERPVGGSEWLLQQLSNGRLKSIFDAPRQPAPPAPAPPTDPAPTEDADGPATVSEAPVASEGDDEPPRAGLPGEGRSASDTAAAARTTPVGTWPGEPVQNVSVQNVSVNDEAESGGSERDQHMEASEERSGAEQSAAEQPDAGSDVDVVESAGAGVPFRRRRSEREPVAPLSEADRGADGEAGRDAPPREGDALSRDEVVTSFFGPGDPAPRLVSPEETASGQVDAPATARTVESASSPDAPATASSSEVDSTADAPLDTRADASQEDVEAPPGRPEGATTPTPRAPGGAVDPDAVYQWPDPRGDWDAPPVWEEVVPSHDDPDDDGGDEELWRDTASAYAWNLEPTAPPSEPEPAPAAPAPFTTAPASAHVNAAEPRTPRGPAPRLLRGRGTSESPAPRPSASEGRAASRRRLLIGLIVLGILVVLAALVAIGFVSASRSPEAAAPPPASSDSEAPSSTPSASTPASTSGPLSAGTWAWNALRGGECLQPFSSAWAEEFTVVSCDTAHAGQLVATGSLTDASYPGQQALAVSVASLCQAQGVIDVEAATAVGDVQVAGTFPVTQEQWDAGERSYYCFVNRAGGGALTGSLAGTPAV